jgi:O-antigen ligase
MAPFAVAIMLLGVIGTLVAVPVTSLLPSSVRDAIFNRLAAGENGRGPLVDLAWHMIRDHPMLGVGINNFAALIRDYASPSGHGPWLYVVHNKYLGVWAETGIVGLIAFLWFLGETIGRGWWGMRASAQVEQASSPGRNKPSGTRIAGVSKANRERGRRLNNRFFSPLILGFTAGIMGQTIHMFVDKFVGRSPTQLLWLAAALLIVMSSMAQREASSPGGTDAPMRQ